MCSICLMKWSCGWRLLEFQGFEQFLMLNVASIFALDDNREQKRVFIINDERDGGAV